MTLTEEGRPMDQNSGSKRTAWTDCAGRSSIAAALRYGSILSTIVMAAGILLSFVRGGVGAAPHAFSLLDLIRKVGDLDPVGVTELGMLLLLLTPVLRVLIAVVGFARERDLKYALISFGVLLIVGVGMFAALR